MGSIPLNVPADDTPVDPGPAAERLQAAMLQVLGAHVDAGGRVDYERLAAAPEVPTLAEATSLPLEVGTWNVVMAPAGTPKDVVDRLNAALNSALKKPAIQERLAGYGINPVIDSTPASTAKFVEGEIAKFHSAFKLSGAEAE